MSSATPSRPAQSNGLVVAALVALLVVAVLVVAAVYWFFASGAAAAFGAWMYASSLGAFVRYVLESLLLLVCVLVSTAVLIYGERKIWGAIHIRRGPNVVGPWGVLQPFADFLKFIFKEPVIPAGANKGVFVIAPLVSVMLALAAWAVIPVADGWVVGDINVGVLYLFAVSSLGVYGIVMAGWASNSKYPFLSALRAAAQMVSYEVSIGFVIVTVLLCAGSLNLTDIVRAQDTRVRPVSAGTGCRCCRCSSSSSSPRSPRPTARRSIWPRRSRSWWRAIMVEYSASLFLLQFLTELVAILRMSAMTTVLFLGGWLSPHSLRAVHLGSRRDLVPVQGVDGGVHVHLRQGVRAALSLRPTDAARLEGVPADLAVHGRCGGGRARSDRLGRASLKMGRLIVRTNRWR